MSYIVNCAETSENTVSLKRQWNW